MATKLFQQGKDSSHQNAGEGSAWTQEMGVYARRIEVRTVGTVTTIYKAWADYGTAEDAASWMVQRIVMDSVQELDVTDGIAGGVAGAFAFTWVDRAGHTYS